MSAKPIPPDQIRKILLLSKGGMSNREIARKLDPPLYKGTVNRYIKFIKATGHDLDVLIGMSDESLDKVFHKGIPAYTDERMNDFFDFLDDFKWDRDEGVNLIEMWNRYRIRCIKRGHKYYSLTQFRHHLANAGLLPTTDLKALVGSVEGPLAAIVTTRSFETSHIDFETGELRMVHLVAVYMVSSELICMRHVDKLDINKVLGALYGLFAFLGGLPDTLEISDLLKSCSKPKDLSPSIKSILRHMLIFYHTDGLTTKDEALCGAREHMERAFNYLKHMLVMAKSRNGWDMLDTLDLFKERYNRTQINKDQLSREEDFIRNERPRLRQLPTAIYKAGEVSEHKVYVDGTIQVGKDKETGYYSVPVEYIGQKVKCVHTDKELLIMGSLGFITSHKPVDDHRYSLKEEHIKKWEESEYNDLKTLEHKAFNLSPSISAWVSQFFQMAPGLGLRNQECIRKYDSIERLALEDRALMSSFCDICVRNNIYNYRTFLSGFYRYRDSYCKDKALGNNFLNDK